MLYGFSVVALCLSASAAAADDAWIARIRTDHPRMFFNADTWPAVRARAEGPARAARDALLRRCDRYPENPVCSGFDPVVFREVKTASGTHKTTGATPIPGVREWGARAAKCSRKEISAHTPLGHPVYALFYGD